MKKFWFNNKEYDLKSFMRDGEEVFELSDKQVEKLKKQIVEETRTNPDFQKELDELRNKYDEGLELATKEKALFVDLNLMMDNFSWANYDIQDANKRKAKVEADTHLIDALLKQITSIHEQRRLVGEEAVRMYFEIDYKIGGFFEHFFKKFRDLYPAEKRVSFHSVKELFDFYFLQNPIGTSEAEIKKFENNDLVFNNANQLCDLNSGYLALINEKDFELEIRIANLKSEYNAEIAPLKEAIARKDIEYSDKISLLEKESANEIARLKEKIDDLKYEHAREIRQLEREHTKEIRQIETNYRLGKKELLKTIDQLREDMTQMKEDHAKKIKHQDFKINLLATTLISLLLSIFVAIGVEVTTSKISEFFYRRQIGIEYQDDNYQSEQEAIEEQFNEYQQPDDNDCFEEKTFDEQFNEYLQSENDNLEEENELTN